MEKLREAIKIRLQLREAFEKLEDSAPEVGRRLGDSPPWSVGRLTLLTTVILVASGLILAFFYQPTAEQAAASLRRLHRQSSVAGLVHNVHRWSALLLIVLTILHALSAWAVKAYRYPREIGWWLGVLLLPLVLSLGATGYLLRWDIKAFSLMNLLVSTLSDWGVDGRLLFEFLLGGSGQDIVALNRGYAVHVWFLPTVLVFVVGLHLFAVARQGLSRSMRPWLRLQERRPFLASVQWVPGLVLLAAVLVLSSLTPSPMANPSPNAISAWPNPDWLLLFYSLPFWSFPESLRVVGILVVPLAVLFLLLAAPRIDSRRTRGAVSIGLVVLGILGVAALFGETARRGTSVPLQGCSACHRPGMLGGAPRSLAEVDTRDPSWLVRHLEQPVDSILTPMEVDPLRDSE